MRVSYLLRLEIRNLETTTHILKRQKMKKRRKKEKDETIQYSYSFLQTCQDKFTLTIEQNGEEKETFDNPFFGHLESFRLPFFSSLV